MELSVKDRLQLSLTLKILEKLYPNEKIYYENHRKAIEEGYELHYSWLTENLSEGMSNEACSEVLDILDMYSGIYFSFQSLQEKNQLSLDKIKFPGFDGNNETNRMLYTKYFIDDLERYEEIRASTKGYYNSHARMLPKYKKMLSKWSSIEIEKRHSLSEENILDLINTY